MLCVKFVVIVSKCFQGTLVGEKNLQFVGFRFFSHFCRLFQLINWKSIPINAPWYVHLYLFERIAIFSNQSKNNCDPISQAGNFWVQNNFLPWLNEKDLLSLCVPLISWLFSDCLEECDTTLFPSYKSERMKLKPLSLRLYLHGAIGHQFLPRLYIN